MMEHEEDEEEMDDFINTSLGKSFVTQKKSTQTSSSPSLLSSMLIGCV